MSRMPDPTLALRGLRRFFAFVIAPMVVAGCDSESSPAGPPPSTTVSLTPSSATMYVGDTQQLSASVANYSGAVTYASSSPTIATVSTTGLVTAVAIGTVTIVASAGEADARTQVTVAPSSISIDRQAVEVARGGEVGLTATVEGGSGHDVRWSSSNLAVARVDAVGNVTGVARGRAVVTASVEGQPGVEASVDVEVLHMERGSYALVSNRFDADVSLIDLATFSEVRRIGVGERPWGVAVHPDGEFAYVANSISNDVSVIDLGTNQVVATIPVGVSPWRIAVAPGGDLAYVVNYGSANLFVLDLETFTVAAVVPTGVGPTDIAIHPDGSRAYVPNRFTSDVTVVDLRDNSVVETIPVGEWPESVAIHPDGDVAYVPSRETSYAPDAGVPAELHVIDLATHTVNTTVPILPRPSGMDVAPDGAFAMVAHYGPDTDQNISIVDLDTNTVRDEIVAGSVARDVAISPDGSYAYVSGNEGFWMIDLGLDAATQRLLLGSGPDATAVFTRSIGAAGGR